MSNLIQLRRHDTGTPWGFRMNGGAELGQPLFIQKVTPGSLAFRAGLRPADGILQIGMVPTGGMTHLQAKSEILRCGNELDFIINRSVVPMERSMREHAEIKQNRPVAQVVNEHVVRPGSPGPFSNAQSRSFQYLQQSLGES